MLKKTFSLVLLMLLMGTVASLEAQELTQNGSNPGQVQQSFPMHPGVETDISLGGPYTLYQTFAKYNNTATVVGSGFRQLDDGTTITCPGPRSCLIEVDEWIQIGSNATDNRWEIAAAVDGTLVDTPNPPIQGYTHIAGQYFYGTGSFVQFAVVSPGTHAVQTYVYSDAGLTKSIWSLIYKVSTS